MSAEAPTEATMREAAALVARYGKGREEPLVLVRIYAPDGSWERSFEVAPSDGARLAEELKRQ